MKVLTTVRNFSGVQGHWKKGLRFLALSILTGWVTAAYGQAKEGEEVSNSDDRTLIRVTGFSHWAWDPVSRARRSALRAWMAKGIDPSTGKVWGDTVRIEPDNPLSFPGFSLKLLNFAAGTGEEVVVTSQGVDQFFQYRDMRFLMPLNPFIWKIKTDASGRPIRGDGGGWDYEMGADGKRILLWPDWEKFPPAYRQLVTRGDDVMGVPVSMSVQGLMYRRDTFRQAGLNADMPPATWEELLSSCFKVCAAEPEGTQRIGIQLTDTILHLYVLGQGGTFAVAQPDGKGWLATIDTPEMVKAIEFGRRLTLTRWVKGPDHKPIIVWDPVSGVPDIRNDELGKGRWEGDPLAAGSKVVFADRTYGPGEIRVGVAMNQLGGLSSGIPQKWYSLFADPDGRLAMAFNAPDRLTSFSGLIDPSLIGYGPVPAGPAGRRLPTEGEIGGLNYNLAKNPEKARLSWAVLSFLSGYDYRREILHSYVREGEDVAETLPPADLIAEGYGTIAERVPKSVRAYWEDVERSTVPAIGIKNYQSLLVKYVGPIFRRASENPLYDFRPDLAEAQKQIQARLDFDAGKFEKVKGRGGLIAGIVLLFSFVIGASWLGFRSLLSAHSGGPDRLPGLNERYGRVAWSLLAPALILVTVFHYYPIFKALPIAFQDYSVVGGSTWVGVDNFVEVFRNPATWWSLVLTGYYMALTVTIGFMAPVVLGILMSEIAAFRYFLRTVYYLPAVVAGIVLLLMWQRFYEPTSQGMVNGVLAWACQLWNSLMPGTGHDIIFQPVDWLRHPVWGIPSVVLVGIWGGMGPHMLIYLAALKSIPEELYEAAEIDGAGWVDRFWHITMSYLRPLLIINFVGTVVGAFQASGNILALAGNYPATYTFAVHVWFESFGLGNFGVGTALSWLMAAILVGFTLWQLNILRRVEFRKSEAD